MGKDELFEHCCRLFSNISVTQDQAKKVEMETREQSRSRAWYRFRAGCLTASRMKAICATPLDKPSQSLIKTICYPQTCNVNTAATTWGCEHEITALELYSDMMKQSHENFTCVKSGLVIHQALPYIAATPDSVISCDCCGEGIVEVKCPYCQRDKKLIDSCDSKSCLEIINGSLSLKH